MSAPLFCAPSIPRERERPSLLVVVFLAASLAACSSSDTTGPDGDDGLDLAALAGRWKATSMVLTSKNDPDVSVDVILNEQLSGSFELVIEDDGRYAATLTVFGIPQTERGTLELAGDTLTFLPDGGSRSEATWRLEGDTLTLDGESEFDFNQDTVPEEATLHLVLERG